jgi:hypothetical protein
MIQLVVISPFLTYGTGDLITDPATVADILAGPYRSDVVTTQNGDQTGPETISVAVLSAVAGSPLVLSGVVSNGAPTALDSSTDNGATWQAISGYALAGVDWTGFGPTFATARTGTLLVRDHAVPTVVSTPVGFTVTGISGGGGTSSGTITLGDGSVIDALGAGLVVPAGTGSLTVSFGTVAGSVADGGALTAETAARISGDAANAAAAAAAQATASAAIPASLLGAASGIAPLDSGAHVPLANVPAIGAQAWVEQVASAGIFHRGPVPGPATVRSGLTLGDKLKIAAVFNFAEIWDTQATYDAWPSLQNFLLYCQQMALAMKNDGIDNLTERNCVRAVLPRGAYFVSQPLIVPEFVDLDCRGTIYRAAYTTDQSNNGTTSVPGPFASNQYLPTVVVVPRGHASNLNIYVNTDGNIAHRGSGVCVGKNWAAEVGQPCTIGNPGSGYSVGDLLFMAQPSVAPYFNWAAQVTAISGSGSTGPIAAATVYATGAYSLPPATYNGGPSLQQQVWTAANGYSGILDAANPGCFFVHSAYASNGTTPSAGTGATLAPTWQPDYVSGTAAYAIGAAITNGSQIGKIQVTGDIPAIISTTYGPTFGVMVTGLETVIDEIQILGGNAGVFGYFAQDVRIGILNVVEAGVGVELFGCGSWHCPNVVLDTCGAAFLINETQGVRFLFRAFFEQGNITVPNAFPNSLGNAIQIGNASSSSFPCSDIRLEGDLVNMGGLPQSTINAYPGTAVGGQTPRPMTASIFLAWLFSSVIRVKVTNIGEQGGSPTILPTSGFCQFGYGVDAGNVIEGVIDTVPTIDGTPPPAQLITLTSGHGYPSCAIRVWDGLHQAWLGPGGVCELYGTAAPASGTAGAGAGFAAPGSVYIDMTGGAGERWVNTGARTSPVWTATTGGSGGGTYTGGTNIDVVSDVISLAAPASATLLSSNAGGTLEPVGLGTGLTIGSGNTLELTGTGTSTLPIYAAGAFWDGNSHPISSALGVSTWAGLMSYGSGEYSFLSAGDYGLVFTDTTTAAPVAAGATTLTFGGPASFTGYVSGTTLTVTAISQGGLSAGQLITEPTSTWTYGGQTFIQTQNSVGVIASQTSGTTGGAGVYALQSSGGTIGSSGSPVALNGSTVARTLPPRIGQQVSGTGIASGCTVTGVSVLSDPSYTVTLSAATTATIPQGETITYHISDSDTAALDMDWLALQALLNKVGNAAGTTGSEYVTAVELPDGCGLMGKWEVIVPVNSTGQDSRGFQGISRIFGRGKESTLLRWDGDVGAGRFSMRPIPSFSDVQMSLRWSDFAMIAFETLSTPGYGVVPNYGHGVLCASHGFYERMDLTGFYSAFYLCADHHTFRDVTASGNWYGFYAGYGVTYGNQIFDNIEASGCYRAAFGAAWNNGFWNSQFKQNNCGKNPMRFYREIVTPGNCGAAFPWLSSCTDYDGSAEANGNCVAFGATAYAAWKAGVFGGGYDTWSQHTLVGNCTGSTDEGGAANSSDPTISSPGLFMLSNVFSCDFGGNDVSLANGADFTHAGYSAIFCVTGFVSGTDLGQAGYELTQDQVINAVSATISGTTLTLSSGTVAAGMVLGGPGVQHGSYIVSGSGSTWTVNKSHSSTGTVTSAGVVPLFSACGAQFIVGNEVSFSYESTQGYFAHWLDTASTGADCIAGQIVQPQTGGEVTNAAAGYVMAGVTLVPGIGFNPVAVVTQGPVNINKASGVTFSGAKPIYVDGTTKSECNSTASGSPVGWAIVDGTGYVRAFLQAAPIVL